MIRRTNNYMLESVKTILLAFALLFVLAACSNDAPSVAPTQASAPTTQATPATPPTVAPATPPTTTPTAPTTQATQAAPPPTTPPAAEPISVVTTTNIVADWVENVGGDRVEVFSLVPVGADPHAFQPGAQDVVKIAEADLALSIGLGLEEAWLHELLQNAARDESSLVELGDAIDPIEFAASHAGEVELLEDLMHIVHEVEDGEIDADTGLEEIEELIADAEDEEEGEEHAGDEELPEHVMEIIAEVEAGDIDAAAAIEAIEALGEEGEEEHEGHGHGVHDPHFWFDPLRVKIAVSDIAARLSTLDPDGSDAYSANAAAYNARLDELHAWTQEQVGLVPSERRLLVTSHDSLGYFANLYEFEVVGVVLSTTTEVEPSAEDLAELIHEIEEFGVQAVFGETTVSERLAEAVATESGVGLFRLYSGSLGTEGSGAETYIDMVRTNVERIVEALK